MQCSTDEATRRAKDGITRPGWPLFVNDRRDTRHSLDCRCKACGKEAA